MPGLLTNTTNVTLPQIEAIGNFTDPAGFLVNVNQLVFNGWLYFMLLVALWVILFIAAQRVKDQPLNNAMYSGAFISICALLLRAITAMINGVRYALVSDHQLWIFPVITIFIAWIVWATKE